jgi:hypothetical protein
MAAPDIFLQLVILPAQAQAKIKPRLDTGHDNTISLMARRRLKAQGPDVSAGALLSKDKKLANGV